MKRSILTGMGILILSPLICASAVAGISGGWICKLTVGDGSTIPLTYHFKQDKDKLSGSADSPQGELLIEDGKIRNDSLTFNVNIQGYDFPHGGRIYPDSIAMDVISHGAKLHTRLVRK